MYPQNGTFMEPPRNCPWLPAHFFRCRGVDHLTGDPKSQAALLYQSGKTQAPAFFSASEGDDGLQHDMETHGNRSFRIN